MAALASSFEPVALADNPTEDRDVDAKLVRGCIAHDESAYAELVVAHYTTVVDLAANLLGDRAEALDSSQEVFLEVFRSIHRFRGDSTLRTWISRMVVAHVSNRRRLWCRGRRSFHVSTKRDTPPWRLRIDDELAPDCERARKELARRASRALDRLPFDQRTCLVLRDVEGLRYKEIAAVLSVTLGTVKTALGRARAALCRELGDQFRLSSRSLEANATGSTAGRLTQSRNGRS